MRIFAPLIRRPVATSLLSLAILLGGIASIYFLPIAVLPNVDIPTIVVTASRPGADPETMASSVAAPLEHQLSQIPGISQIFSTSTTGATSVVISFDIDRSLDAAARDVEAAINAAESVLPSDLPQRPTFRKYDPSGEPIFFIALTSSSRSISELYDVAIGVFRQRISQINGVSNVEVSGSGKPSIRIDVDPALLASKGLSLEDVANVIKQENVILPLGNFQGPLASQPIATNGQLSKADQYRRLLIKAGDGSFSRLSEVATVEFGVANSHISASLGHTPGILISVFKRAGGNVIRTVTEIRGILPQLVKRMPPNVRATVISDPTNSIRTSVEHAEQTFIASMILVLSVVYLFLRDIRLTISAAIVIPLSTAATFLGMSALGYSLDNFSLMALTISVGFVVDDAIVMVDNVVRHLEIGEAPLIASLRGASQISFTLISMSVSLIAVFVPLSFLPGVLGRYFHEFSATIAIAITASAVISLTVTPMLVGHLNFRRPSSQQRHLPKSLFFRLRSAYGRSIQWALSHPAIMLCVLCLSIGATIWLYEIAPKGLIPSSNTDLLRGSTVASPDTSFQAMTGLQNEVVDTILRDPAVKEVGSNIGISNGFSKMNTGSIVVELRTPDGFSEPSGSVATRLQKQLNKIPGVHTFLNAVEAAVGSNTGQYQFILRDQNVAELRHWVQIIEDRLRKIRLIEDVASDQDAAAPLAKLIINRTSAARLGVNVSGIDSTLNDAFAERQISRIYDDDRQYDVVLNVRHDLQTSPAGLDRIYVSATNVNGTTAPALATRTALQNPTDAVTFGSVSGGVQIGGRQIPLLAISRVEMGKAPTTVNHVDQLASATLSFNLRQGVALGEALVAIRDAAATLEMPESLHYEFGGNAKTFTQLSWDEPLLIFAAIIAIYVTLGVLYESLIQPLTILSTLPPAGLGALLAMRITGYEFTLVSMIGILLLMGIVKKNGILLVDFALEAERREGKDARTAIYEACMQRFRPILMTTCAAILGAVPLAFAFGAGAELRRPLGISIIGGLIVSQILTLYTTPVMYLFLEKIARRSQGRPAIEGLP